MGKRGFWIRLAAAGASGMMMAVVFAPYNMTAFVWIAVMPLIAGLWSVQGKRPGWSGFALGYLAGAVAFLIQLNWLSVVTGLGAIVLPLYLAIYVGLFGAFAAKWGNPWQGGRLGALGCAFANAGVWAGLEIARGWVFTGFGWNGLGVGLHHQLVMAQAADLLGVAGLSGMLVFVQSLLVSGVKRKAWQDFAVAAAIVIMMAGYGFYRISSERGRESTRLKSLLVQINIPQEAALMLWTAEETHMAYEEETLKGLAANKEKWPDWVVWPETALTGRILRADDDVWGMWEQNRITIGQIRQAGPFQLIFGVTELEAVAQGDQLVMKPQAHAYNSLAVMSPSNELQTFRKHHLVIFGETIPFVDSVPFLKKIYEQQSGAEYHGAFTAGTSFEPLPIVTGKHTIGAIPTVCFEDTVPRLTRKFVRPGPQVIVNVTNDGWFKETQAAEQHFNNARFRAIELRRPMLRSANTGVSAAIDTTGSTRHPDTGVDQILRDSRGNHFTRGTLLTELAVPVQPMLTLYSRIGDWGVLSLALSGSFLAFCRRKCRSQAVG